MRSITAIIALWTIVVPLAALDASEGEHVAYDEATPAAGFWVGDLATDAGKAYVVLDITNSDGAWAATANVPEYAIVGTAVSKLVVDDGAVSFDAAGMLGRMHVEVAVSDDGQQLEGTAMVSRGGAPVECVALLRRSRPVRALTDMQAYSGVVDVRGMAKLEMTIVRSRTAGGRNLVYLDVPAQLTAGLPLTEVAVDGDAVTATLPGPAPARFELVHDADEDTLTGVLRQAGMELEIDFDRNLGYTAPGMRRPQHPSPPYPYTVEEISVAHPDGHILAGTLTRPTGAGRAPAAVLISGSGPQDRDESLLGHKPFLVIADHLTRAGIAVMRYDDRGTGASTGRFGNATSADFATDVAAVVDHIATLEGIDPDRIGLIGHSEGGLVAPIVASEHPDDIAFIVLLAGPGVTGRDILELQGRLIMEAGGATPQGLDEYTARQTVLLDMVVDGATGEEIAAAIEPIVRAELNELEDAEGAVAQMVSQQVHQLTSPWMRYFLTYDPAPALRATKCPVLAVNGTLDLQVWHEQNLDAIEQLITEAGGDVTIERYEGLNHLFQPAKTGSVSEYAQIETTFDEHVLDDMAEWINGKMAETTDAQ